MPFRRLRLFKVVISFFHPTAKRSQPSLITYRIPIIKTFLVDFCTSFWYLEEFEKRRSILIKKVKVIYRASFFKYLVNVFFE